MPNTAAPCASRNWWYKLLDSVRIESGEMRLRKQPVELAAVVARHRADAAWWINVTSNRPRAPSGSILTGDSQRLLS